VAIPHRERSRGGLGGGDHAIVRRNAFRSRLAWIGGRQKGRLRFDAAASPAATFDQAALAHFIIGFGHGREIDAELIGKQPLWGEAVARSQAACLDVVHQRGCDRAIFRAGQG